MSDPRAMSLDYKPLEQAIARLGEALEIHREFKPEDRLFETTRDSVVQRFEFTYELAAKFLAKHLQRLGYTKSKASPDNKPVLFRTAGEAELVPDVDAWLQYNKSRNVTSHEYIETYVKSEEFFASIRAFYADAQQLLATLKAPPQ